MRTHTTPQMTPAQSALVVLMYQYTLPAMDIATITEAHHLMYFLQESGENLGLQYKKAPYGLYAQNLNPLLAQMKDRFIVFGADVNGVVENPLYLRSGAIEQAEKLLSENTDVLARCDRIAKLFEGFEMAYGIELLVTAHWVTTREQATTSQIAVEKVHAWDERQRTFAPYGIQFAWQHLNKMGWL